MSFDLIAYFGSKPRGLPETVSGADWIVNVEQPLPIVADDLPTGLRARMGRRKWQVEVHLEGAHGDAASNALEHAIAELVDAGAAIFDPQAESVRIGGDTWPIPAMENPADEELGFSLHCFFERADQIEPERIGQLLDFLAERLPEALPHRYGTYEPAPFRWAEGGKDAFLIRWRRYEPPFWIGRTPAAHTFLSFDFRLGRPLRLFRAGHVEFQFRAKLAERPRTMLAVLELGEWLAVNFDAFYTALIPGRESHGPFWKGLVPDRHLMIILGPPLVDRWDGFAAISTKLGARHRQAGSSSGGLIDILPPVELCYQATSSTTPVPGPSLRAGVEYAMDFPFERCVDPYQPE